MCVVHLICTGGRRLGGSQLSRTRFLFWRSGSDFISISSHQPGGRERGEVALRSLAISQVTACSDEAEGRFPASEERERERERVSERVFACGVLFQPSTQSSAVLQPAVCSVQSCSSEGGSQLSGKVQVCFCNSKSLFGGVGPNCPGPRLKSRSPAPAGLGVSSHRRFLLGGPVAETV